MAPKDAFIVVTLFVSSIIIVPTLSAPLVNNCDGTPVVIKDVAGSISLNGSIKEQNVSCLWSLDGTSTKPLSLFLGGKEPVKLHPKDTLEILDEKGVVNVNLTGDDLKKWGVILSTVSGKGTIRLNISADAGDRQFHSGFDRNVAGAIFHYNEPHDYVIPINHIGNTAQNGVLGSYSVSFVLDPTFDPEKLLLLNYRQIVGTPSIAVEGSSAAKDDKTPGFDLLNDVVDSKSKIVPLKITINNFDYSNTRLVLGTEIVDKSCSEYKQLSKTEVKYDITGPTNPPDGSSLNCVWLVRSDVPLRIDNSLTRALYGDDDVVEVIDGPRLLNNKILCELNKQNLDESEHSFSHTVSTQSQIRVSLVSKYVTETTGLWKVTVSRATKSQINPTGVIDVTGDGGEVSPLFLFTAKDGEKAVFTVDKTPIAGTNLSFYSSDERKAVPFMTVTKGNLLPPRIVSPTQVLRVSVSNGDASNVKAKFSSEATLDATAIGDSDSIMLSNLSNGSNTCWLIPSRAIPGSVHLNIPRLILANDPSNCVELKKLTDKSTSIFKSCYNPKLTAVATRALPRILLNSASAYILIYSAGTNVPTPGMGTSLLEASVSYSVECPVVNQTLPDGGGVVVVAPESYPNSYRLNEATLGDECNTRLFNKPGSVIHVVFEDIDLKADQTLTVRGPQFAQILNKNDVIANVHDFVIPDSSLLNMSSPLKADYSATGLNDISGRGFKLNISSTTCGGYIDATKLTNLTTNGYPNATSASKCVWILSADSSKLANAIVNITRIFGKDGSDGDLTIYDNPNSRVNRYNSKYVVNDTFTTSVSTTVIMYTPKVGSKTPMKALMLNWTIDSCDHHHSEGKPWVCQNEPTRCILPTWICNGVNDCGDNSDELHCNGTIPTPPPPEPKPCQSGGGVNGWVIVLVIIPMAIFVGILISRFGPVLMARFSERRGRYAEFNDFAEVS